MITRKSFAFLGFGAAALGLTGIGAGTGAIFTSAGTITGQATTGTVTVAAAVPGAGGAVLCTSDNSNCTPPTATSNGQAINFGAFTNLGSTFSITLPFTLTNTGSLPVGSFTFDLTDHGAIAGAGASVVTEDVSCQGAGGSFAPSSDIAANSGASTWSLKNAFGKTATLQTGQVVDCTLIMDATNLPNQYQGKSLNPSISWTATEATS